MQVVTHFTFSNNSEYAAFCRHMAAFNPGESPAAPETYKPVGKNPMPPAEVQVIPVVHKQKETEKTTSKEEPKNEKKDDPTVVPQPDAVPPTGERLDNEPTYDNMKKSVLAVSQKYKSKTRAFEILGKFGYEKITKDMDVAHFPAIIKECQKALDAAE